MRVAAIADLHVGAGTDYADDRLADQERTLNAFADELEDRVEPVDAVLVLGDVFHRPRPSPRELLVAQRFLRRLSLVANSVIVLAGNHDLAGAGDQCVLDLFADPDEGIVVVTRPTVIRLDVAAGSIACLPWTHPGPFYAQHPEQDRDDLAGDLGAALVEVAAGLRAQCPEASPAILAAHWSLSGAYTPLGAATDDFREPVLRTVDLAAQGWDAILAGHIHLAQTVGGFPRVRYVGSPSVTDFGEATSWHGAGLLEVDDNMTLATNWTPISLPDRPFLTITDLDAAYLDADVAGAVVRVRYQATAEEAAAIDHDALRKRILAAGAHRVYQVTPTITDPVRARADDVTSHVEPAAAAERWIELRSLSTFAADTLRSRVGGAS